MADHLQPGQVLKEHLYMPGTKTPILRAGSPLTPPVIDRITSMGLVGAALAAVHGDDRRADGTRIVAEPDPGEPFLTADEALVLRDILAGRGSQTGLRRIVYDLAARLDRLPGPVDFRVPGAHAKTHAINVFTLSLAIAHAMEYGPAQLLCLGTGALFQDVGMEVLPARILGKAGRLSPEEFEMVRHHPTLSLAVLARSRQFTRWLFPPETQEVIRFHHERLDGSGYPLGLAGAEIPRMAGIAAVADVYDAMVSDRLYARRRLPGLAYQVVRGMAGRLLDPAAVEAFQRRVLPYPPGMDVFLSDGRVGRVARASALAPLRPVVVVDGSELDLATDRTCAIVRVRIARAENRIPSAMAVRVRTREGQALPGKAVNLSPDGACLDVQGDLPAGTHVAVDFFQGTLPVGSTRGNICWIDKAGDGSSRLGMYALGANLTGQFAKRAC